MADYVEYHVEEMEMFWRFMAERHLIYKRKDLWGRNPPWTHCPILANYKFTNVCRNLDRGTKFVTHHILANDELSDIDMIFNVVAYRIFNKAETFLHHGFLNVETYDAEAFHDDVLSYEAKSDIAIWTNAFIVSPLSLPELSGLSKLRRISIIFGWIRDQLIKDPSIVKTIMADTTMKDTYDKLLGFTGVGPFLGYQMAVDLSYWHKTNFGEDDFVVLGPGAKRGIQVLFPEHTIKQWGYQHLNFWLRDRQYEFYKDYDIDYETLFEDMSLPYLTVMTFENLLCEISKYNKAVNKKGRPRNTYTATDGQRRMRKNRKNEAWNAEPYDVFTKEQNRKNYDRLMNG
jgi:hypothetical protein